MRTKTITSLLISDRSFFFTERAADDRLKKSPGMPISTSAAVRDLAAVYSLRSLELAEGAALTIEANNAAAAMPIIRSLLEVWMAVMYVRVKFGRAIEAGTPDDFGEGARQLLTGRTGAPDAERYPLSIGTIRGVAQEAVRDIKLQKADGETTTLEREVKRLYGELSDSSHLVQWIMMPYWSERPDGLGSAWSGKPVAGLELAIMNLAFALGLVRRFIPDLRTLANRVA